jgi:hypothetical protein
MFSSFPYFSYFAEENNKLVWNNIKEALWISLLRGFGADNGEESPPEQGEKTKLIPLFCNATAE